MTEVSTEVSGETTRTLRYLRSQIFLTSKFSTLVWLTEKRHLLAKWALLREHSRPQTSQDHPLQHSNRFASRPIEAKFLRLSGGRARLVNGAPQQRKRGSRSGGLCSPGKLRRRVIYITVISLDRPGNLWVSAKFSVWPPFR